MPWEIIRREDGKLVRVETKKPFYQRIKISRRVVLGGLVALVVWTGVGIASWKLSKGIFGPRTPSLGSDSEYHCAKKVFGSTLPTVQGASREPPPGEYPSGTTDQERQLVEYKKKAAKQPATLEVTYVDLPATTDLAVHLAKPSQGQPAWNPTAAAAPISIGTTEAMRYIFNNGAGPDPIMKEVVVFRRGDRVYFFTGTFTKSDQQSQQEIRRAVETIAW